MKQQLAAIALILAFSVAGFNQMPFSEDTFRAFDANGRSVTINEIVTAIGANDVAFLGELHDDAVGHAVQAEIFGRAVALYSTDRRMALSLEMFERDIQGVIDEFLGGLITENHFMLSSRPWGNYKWDYKPLVDLAKDRKLKVIAANPPRRYINMVSRNGRDALNVLPADTKKWFAPLPYGEPSAAYSKKFRALMGTSAEAQMGIDKILASQALWDATMAHSVFLFVENNRKPLVIHLNGSFHTESRLGTVEHLLKYRPQTKALVVSVRYEEDFKKFDPGRHTGLGDFVILTDAKQPRSKR